VKSCRRLHHLAGGTAAVVAGVLVLAGSALAAAPKNSTTYAGYKVSSAGAVTVSAQFVIPTANCSGAGTTFQSSSPSVGVGSGKASIEVGVGLQCNNGSPSGDYPEFFQIGPELSTDPGYAQPNGPRAGNTIDLSASNNGTGTKSATFTDVTTGFSYSFTEPAPKVTKMISAFVESGNPTAWTGSPVPNFGSVTFSDVLVNGSPLKAAKPKAYQQATAAHVVQISVGTLDSSGEIFTLTYEHS
jgi:surface antigen